MKECQDLVYEFHREFCIPSSTSPNLGHPLDRKLRMKLIDEEVQELREALDEADIVKVAHELADVLYVVYGSFVTFGIDANAVFQEVHRANMSKIGATVREDGKIIKPDTYTPPNVAAVLRGPRIEHNDPKEMVNSPLHYRKNPSGIEIIELIRHMGFNLGNVVKYAARADFKGGIEDLKKALFYLQDEIRKRSGILGKPAPVRIPGVDDGSPA